MIKFTACIAQVSPVFLNKEATTEKAIEAILEAGGFNAATANYSKVSVIRIVNGQQVTRVIDLSPVVKGKPTAVFYVKGYDAIFVPKRWSARE